MVQYVQLVLLAIFHIFHRMFVHFQFQVDIIRFPPRPSRSTFSSETSQSTGFSSTIRSAKSIATRAPAPPRAPPSSSCRAPSRRRPRRRRLRAARVMQRWEVRPPKLLACKMPQMAGGFGGRKSKNGNQMGVSINGCTPKSRSTWFMYRKPY